MADDSKLSPQPEPEIEPGEPNPGGADAVEPIEHTPLARDLDPEDNPAVDDVLPDEVAEADDKSQEPTTDGASDPQSESPA
ncbi:MAG: hypothetical protein H0X12_15865 [Nocardioides sp.]|nr:hypothetical protein [Nocardioides sp.]